MLDSNNEQFRIESLESFRILDTMPEQEFDDLALLASQICEVPIALISLVDENRQWFKSRVGLAATETHRDLAFCAHAIEGDDLFVVPNAEQDIRFSNNLLVTGEPHIRFYAGTPLVTSDGYKLGTLCVIDRKPRELNESQKRALNALARSVMNLIETRREVHNLKESEISNNEKIIEESLISRFLHLRREKKTNATFFDHFIKHYVIATLIIAAITLLKALIESATQIESPYLLYAFAILLCAWRGGFGVGIYATILTTGIIDYFFISPYGMIFERGFGQNLRLIVFFVQGTLISILCASRLKNEQLLKKAGAELENRIISRTDQLSQANKDLQQEIKERAHLQEDLQKARDSALETTRLKSEFLANMSHEIRTPMNGVIGVTGLLLDTKLNPEQKKFAEIIRSSGESLLTLINDILDFSKVEAGKLELETLDFNLRNTVEETIELFSTKAEENQNELAMLIYSDVPLELRGDAGRIRQILNNLISNAIKFTKRGDVVVRIKKVGETDKNIELSFSVTDTGEGIPVNVQSQLFQPFTQSDASTTRRFGGTGLGLSICKRLAEIMDGSIGVESEKGKGSTFWFNIKLEKQVFSSTENFNESKSVSTHSELAGQRILIVDDNPVNREVLAYQTKVWEMDSDNSSTGEDAVKILNTAIKNRKPFDLVILDFQIPNVESLEIARQFIIKNSVEANLPAPSIIVLSSSGLKLNDEEMKQLGISAFLTKPYRQNELLETIKKTIRLNRTESFSFETYSFNEDDIHVTIKPETIVVPMKSKRILLVEDNSVNQLVAQSQLKKSGYQTDVVGNGREALEALEIIPYDLILMDCQMPEMDGYEATKAIRALDWEAAKIPIIALTAHAIESERQKCFQNGMDDFLSKPVKKEDLQIIVNRWLAEEEIEIISTEEKFESSLNTAEKSNPNEILIESEEITYDFSNPVNFATLDDITGYDAEMRRTVVEMYLTQTNEQISEIERAITFNDAETLYSMAHKTVGSSSICGMTAIVEPMRKLEQLGKAGKIKEATPVLQQAKQAFVYINKECTEILRG